MTKQRKKGRPRSENPMVHTAVVLPRDLLELLRASALASNKGLSAEIRGRLQLSYSFQYDTETSEMSAFIRDLARKIFGNLGRRWFEHPYTLAAFKAGLPVFLSRYHPEGDESALPDVGTIGEPRDPPDAVGRTYARQCLVDRYGLAAAPRED